MSDACGGADSLVLYNIVHYVYPAMRTTIMSRLSLNRINHLRQAKELAQFAQSTEIEAHVKHFGRDVVSVVEPTKVPRKIENARKQRDIQGPNRCYLCGNTGHLKAACPKKVSKKQDAAFVLVVQDDLHCSPSHWVLDSGSGRHLGNDLSLLEGAVDCKTEWFTAASDSGSLRITKKVSPVIRGKALV